MSLLQQSYDRNCVLGVYNTQAIQAGIASSLTVTNPLGYQFPSKLTSGEPGFRIKFKIEKVTGQVPSPHLGSISIWNVGATSRAALSKLNSIVILEAGYGNSKQTIFHGNVIKAFTKKEGSDYVTEITAGDGNFAFQNSMINLGYSTPTPTTSVISSLTASLSSAGVTPGVITPTLNSYNNGIVLSGKVVDELQKVCEKNDLDWTIEDGKLNIIPYGGFKLSAPILVQSGTGLVGIPEIREVDLNQKATLSFKVLLNPAIGLYQNVTIISKFFNGVVTVLKTTHTGDTFGQEWYTECEAVGQGVGSVLGGIANQVGA